MSVKQTLRWVVVYRALSATAFVFGFGLVAVGLALGLDFDSSALLNGNLDGAVGSDAPLAGGLLVLAGVSGWRIGKAAALYYTLSGAVEDRMSRRFDPERVKSDILAVLDDRLAGMEQQLRGTDVHEATETRSGNQFHHEAAETQSGNQFQYDDGQ